MLVPLRELVPNHIKAAYTMEMKRCGSEETGRAFLKYLLDALMAEMRAQETNPKRTDQATDKTNSQAKNVTERPKVLGKMYRTRGKVREMGSTSSSSGEESSTNSGRMRKVDIDSEQPHYVALTKNRGGDVPKCTCCNKGSHLLHNCYKFVHKYSLQKKRKFAEKEGRCFRCMRSGTPSSQLFG